ncbi:class I SAM-dependent methyltransferase [Streptacidiphilus carbonis]|uniref:class I SAM-dependent methyltransferase n=1 Tax=Streptacidiphilus carbonis TaxID=105422 RepID=UPI0005AA9658|nr:class I SAM-dependent methyltransferase [Streptacidiphilus carbonis]
MVFADANADQVRAWNGEEGRYWVRHLERHEAMFRQLTVTLLDAARIAPDSRVLDIGCGCGRTTVLAAQRADRSQALGLDLSAVMLEQARRQPECQGQGRIRFEQADMQLRSLPESGFDIALSRFGVMFFADPQTAFTKIARALRPGGRLAFLCWRAPADNEFLTVPATAIARHAHLPRPATPSTPGPFRLADPEGTRELLTSTGFTQVRIEPVDTPIQMGTDAADVAGYLLDAPLMHAALTSAAQDTRARMLTALTCALDHYQAPEGILLGAAAWLVTAQRDGPDTFRQ